MANGTFQVLRLPTENVRYLVLPNPGRSGENEELLSKSRYLAHWIETCRRLRLSLDFYHIHGNIMNCIVLVTLCCNL